MSTGVKSSESQPCGQPKCAKYKRTHSADECWQLHPEKKAEFHAKDKSPKSPNESTSAKKNLRRLVRAGQGKNGKRGGGKNDNKAKQELKRIKAYLTKNEVLAAEDISMIAKGGDPDNDESKNK